jgi:hypothetical protein
MAISMSGRTVMMVILDVDRMLSVMTIPVRGNGNADRGTECATGNGAFTPADFGAYGGTQSTTDRAAEHCIAVHGQRGRGG